MNQLIEKVREWGVEKGITGPNGKGTKIAQTCKFLEEVTETVTAVLKDDRAEIKDGIGDTQVTLILLCEMQGLRIEDIVGEDIFHEKVLRVLSGKIEVALANEAAAEVLFAVITDDRDHLWRAIRSIMEKLVRLSSYYGWTLQECLQAAYDVISKRRGEMVGGSFVKSSAPEDDMDEPLGPACQLGDETCESCQ